MRRSSFNTRGFTIVELLIVVVIIAILAAITIVAYNGITQRAANAKTSQALTSWIKTLNIYKGDKSAWPAASSCLGSGYLYGVSGTDPSGTAQCRSAGGLVITVNSTFTNLLLPYVGSNSPTPSFVTARTSDISWRRGLTYIYGGGSGDQVYVEAVFQGILPTCPIAAGLTGSRDATTGNTHCIYLIGLTTDT